MALERISNPKIADLVGATPTPAPASPGRGDSVLAERLGAEFAGVLQDRLKVSGHAQTRLQSRGIELGDAEWKRVMGGVEKAAAKGAKESLVMMDDVALVVSVKNRTLITAVDSTTAKENVFTNIDSAVIV